jgi:bifunctional non-homologous end joining protein LigD
MVAAEAVAVSAFQTYNFNVFFKFIQPCSPVLAKSVPAGDDWQHEIKFDGFRVQVHIIGKTVELYSRNGGRFSPRFPRWVSTLSEFLARLAIIDGEFLASNAGGIPDFWPCSYDQPN